MRTTLLLSLLVVSFGLTTLSLLMIRTSLQRQSRLELTTELARASATFTNLQRQRRQMLSHETQLLSDLPSLKALMTTNDERTIADGALPFANDSGSAFFALMDRSGRVIACYENGRALGAGKRPPDLQPLLVIRSTTHYVQSDDRLFEVTFKPLYFGSAEQGSLLGFVVVGYAVDNQVAREVGDATAADSVFMVGDTVVASTLKPSTLRAFTSYATHKVALQDSDLWLAGEHYLVATSRLSEPGAAEVDLSVLESFDAASRYEQHLNHLLLGAGGLVLLLGCALAIFISRTITQPLEELVAGVRALGKGDYHFPLGTGGARELRELRMTFEAVRERLLKVQQELLEAERLATIGSMASSISHDLRHYLSAVYANAEFLGYSSTKPEERADLLNEVRLGVQGMTELIESLLIFSRTGQAIHITYESLPMLAERAASLLRTHPDAQTVTVKLESLPSIECWMDSGKMQRAIYNLLLNACHAAKFGSSSPTVKLLLEEDAEWIKVRVEDNGAGVSASVRVTMFRPFVSEGKHGGSGLGLPLANRIAEEHGGNVTLEESRPGRTVFRLSMAKSKLQALRHAELNRNAIEPKESIQPASQGIGGGV
jgi:signal transduction histidine kinase